MVNRCDPRVDVIINDQQIEVVRYEVESVVCEIPSVYIRTDQVKSRDAIASKNYLNKKK